MIGVHATHLNSDGNGQEVTDTTALDDTLACRRCTTLLFQKIITGLDTDELVENFIIMFTP
jgi:hypothetical protein